MAEVIIKPNREEIVEANPIEEIFASGQRTSRKLSANEVDGLRQIIQNPKPPTKALRHAVSQGLQVEAADTDSSHS